jgi:hypothetical protein
MITLWRDVRAAEAEIDENHERGQWITEVI